MRLEGPVAKMRTVLANPIKYFLEMGDDFIPANDLIGKNLKIQYLGRITCFCGKEVDEVFRMNFCKNCFFTLPQAGDSILSPEKSTAHLDIEDRDLAWEKEHQLQPHLVYLANSAGLKVGVTRESQRPTRWIDQGAIEAVVLAETTNRYEAGMIEVALKQHMSDKTPWQKMVKGEDPEIDLLKEKSAAIKLIPEEFRAFASPDDSITRMNYPVQDYPAKAISVNLEKMGSVEGKVVGIRGQYILFDHGGALNVRSHEGRHLALSFR